MQMSFIPPDILGLREDTEQAIDEETAEIEEEREEREGGGNGVIRARNNRRRELERGAGYRGELYS